MDSNNVIEVENISKSYGNKEILKIDNFVIKKGEIYGLLGLNGAGKSTLMKILLSLVPSESGSIRILSEVISGKNRSYLNQIGALIEEASYYPNLTAYENLLIFQKMLNFDKKNIDEALEIVGLLNEKEKVVKKYSLGMKQRLGIAFALVKKPQILILDEPTNGLDPEGIHEIRELIKRLAQKGLTILVSSHILSEIEQIADRVGIIHLGQLIFESKMEELKTRHWIRIKGNFASGDRLRELLKNENIEIFEFGKNRVKIRDYGDKNNAHLLKVLIDKGFEITDFTKQQETLEDIFLMLTNSQEGI